MPKRVFDRPSKAWIELSDDYRLVYQGGHHNVYCNGSRHYQTSGGSAGLSSSDFGKGFTGACDCQRWKSADPFGTEWLRPSAPEKA